MRSMIATSSSLHLKELVPTKIAWEYCSLTFSPRVISSSSSSARSRCGLPNSSGYAMDTAEQARGCTVSGRS